MAAVGDKQDLDWFPIDTRATALKLSCTADWKAKFTPHLEARLVNWEEYLAKHGSSRKTQRLLAFYESRVWEVSRESQPSNAAKWRIHSSPATPGTSIYVSQITMTGVEYLSACVD